MALTSIPSGGRWLFRRRDARGTQPNRGGEPREIKLEPRVRAIAGPPDTCPWRGRKAFVSCWTDTEPGIPDETEGLHQSRMSMVLNDTGVLRFMNNTAPRGGTTSKVNSVLGPNFVVRRVFRVNSLISKISPCSKRLSVSPNPAMLVELNSTEEVRFLTWFKSLYRMMVLPGVRSMGSPAAALATWN